MNTEGKGPAATASSAIFPQYGNCSTIRWFLDIFYRKSLDRFVYGGLTSLFAKNDRRVIDGGIDGICFFTEGSGRLFSFLQSGMLQYNLLIMLLAAGAAVLYFLI